MSSLFPLHLQAYGYLLAPCNGTRMEASHFLRVLAPLGVVELARSGGTTAPKQEQNVAWHQPGLLYLAKPRSRLERGWGGLGPSTSERHSGAAPGGMKRARFTMLRAEVPRFSTM